MIDIFKELPASAERSEELVQLDSPTFERLSSGMVVFVRKEDISEDGRLRAGASIFIRKQDKHAEAEFDALVDQVMEEEVQLLDKLADL